MLTKPTAHSWSESNSTSLHQTQYGSHRWATPASSRSRRQSPTSSNGSSKNSPTAASKRGVFTSVPDLIDAITTWIDHRNFDPKPFVWHAAADDIIKKVRRGREALSQAKTFTEH